MQRLLRGPEGDEVAVLLHQDPGGRGAAEKEVHRGLPAPLEDGGQPFSLPWVLRATGTGGPTSPATTTAPGTAEEEVQVSFLWGEENQLEREGTSLAYPCILPCVAP